MGTKFGASKKIIVPKSVIDKWLHYDNSYKKKDVRGLLGMDQLTYEISLEQPWKFYTVEHMKAIAALTKKDIASVFWACYKKPLRETLGTDGEKITQALEKRGIQ